jgi:signal transduction histidine kinase
MSALSDTSKTNKVASKRQTSTHQAVMATNYRLWLGVSILASTVAGFALVAYLLLAVQWFSQPFLGVMLTRSLVVDGSQSLGNVGWAGLQAGLQREDYLVQIVLQPLAGDFGDFANAQQNYQQILANLQQNDVIHVEFLRPVENGITPSGGVVRCTRIDIEMARCEAEYRLSDFGEENIIAYFVIPYISGVIVFITGLVVLWRRHEQPAGRVISAYCALMSIFMIGIFDLNSTHRLIPLWLAATTLMGGTIGTLALIFPGTSSQIFKRPANRLIPLFISAAAALIIIAFHFFTTNPWADLVLPAASIAVSLLGLLMFLFAVLNYRSNAVTPIIRNQSNIILIGIGLAAAPVAVWTLNFLGEFISQQDFVGFNTAAAMPFFVVVPLSLAYAALQNRPMDSDRLATQSITYSIMLVALVLGYSLMTIGVTYLAQSLLQNARIDVADDPLFVALMIFAIAMLFLPVRTRLQRYIDQIYFRVRHSLQGHLESFSEKLTTLTDIQQVVSEYRHILDETLVPNNAFIFLPNRQTGNYTAFGASKPETDVSFGATSSVVSLLQGRDALVYLHPEQPWPQELRAERARLVILGTLVLIGMRGRSRLNGFVCISAPRSGKGAYSHEELRFIQNLTGQMAIAIERAQVVESLESRVRELDVLSQVSQAVNFTVEYDDLLELISTQTSRLIPAPNFYITLRDTILNELYFAFLLEDDERYREKENKRWSMGRDLFSEIVRSGQPMRVNNYAQTMAQRNSPILYESPELKGWMGVPLIAGQRTLGVMSVGHTEPGKSYNDEQLKIFNDIAALAATSLDKARLFEETNLRARQLSALNDISRKLASELQIDKLLELITSSAVSILNAEAGSLLLTVDDGSGDLEFKVAVGGSGQELVGSRFPAGKGLVGEVATKGRHVIVNDTSNDPRWGGEVSPESFRTSAVLAVPLLAQNRVIGVLEVLNKKGGGAYIEEDASLLTTFAGQAAIAIENARLFQMTDLQLSAQVEELQTLERIDVELNRSLDLDRVAEITMRWAIANSGATAGALGLVAGEPAYLHIIAKYGYQDADFPQEAEGDMWPLDRGIVSRVLRTRQPDLAPDVSIDPDYIPSLRGCKSQITVPMLSAGEINAVLILETNKEPRLNLLDLAFVQRLAEHASIAIANAQLYEQLNRANQSKSEFVSFVAHELKSPLTSIKGYTDFLLKGMVGTLNEQQAAFLGTVRSNADRMNTLISDLNDVTKMDTKQFHMEFSPVAFRNVLTETLRPLQKLIEEKEQRLDLQVPEEMPDIMADQNRLIQVLTNLISNAHKYTPPKGDIIIRGEIIDHVMNTHSRDKSRREEVVPSLHIAVKDTGIGMSEEDLAKLFTPYFRSDNPLAREQPGTGLGLTITRNIISLHGGEIWVESKIGEGTTFHFTVPLAEEKQPEPASD